MSPPTARAIVLDALIRWEREREFADDVIHVALSRKGIRPVDRAFAMELFYGSLRYLARLDFLIGRLREGNVDSRTRQALRLGLYQIFHTRVAPHAAVSETVELAGRSRGLVNAVLRSALRERGALGAALEAAPDPVRLSHPAFLLDRWRARFGDENARSLCQWNNAPAPVLLRANGLKVTRGELLSVAPWAVPHPFHKTTWSAPHIPLTWLEQGLCYAQDPSTLIACDLLDPKPGETVLDACAAPGGKTAYMAVLMENTGRIAACDRGAERVARMMENLIRLGVANAQPIQLDWTKGRIPFGREMFDRILVDAPCSNTGVLRRRVDARWRLTPEDFRKMPAIQRELVGAVAPLLKPGGRLVYSTCSMEPEENEAVAERIADDFPNLRPIGQRATLPFADSVDGAFAAAFEKAAR